MSHCINCGHDRDHHIYHEGACRPGFTCACLQFVSLDKHRRTDGRTELQVEQYRNSSLTLRLERATKALGVAARERHLNRSVLAFLKIQNESQMVALKEKHRVLSIDWATLKGRNLELTRTIGALEFEVLRLKNHCDSWKKSFQQILKQQRERENRKRRLARRRAKK